ncbi:alpha-1,2-fucosyltransferase [Pedobacter sp. AW1-32]|uniref:alpha-1,2-fucosyltransferase n=1 Tax=Pedobacter sp. AW1-32 TaxID=3383026 RepID=UPI003FF081EA
MDVVVFFNGLGNQMSQYAFYLQKREIDKRTEYIDFCRQHNGLELSRIFNINIETNAKKGILYVLFRFLLTEKLKLVNFLKNIFKKRKINIIKEKYDYSFNKDYLMPSKSGITYYFGGWPSEKYFISVKDKVAKSFEFVKPEDEDNVTMLNKIKTENSVAIHIRRGDYLQGDNINIFGGVCTVTYFENAIKKIEESVINPHFFVFSNDIPWVKDNLNMKNSTYVTFNSGENSWKDMYLMSNCNHNIISNSTFSWWGAWLNKNPEKIVISPSRYLNNDVKTDVYPDSWIKITEY